MRTPLRQLLLATCSVLAATAAGLAGLPAPYLRLPLDGSLQSEGVGSAQLATVEPGAAALTFVPGLAGQGLLAEKGLLLKGKGIWPQPEGTVLLWVKPQGWAQGKPVGGFVRTFCANDGEAAECLLYQYLRDTFWYEGWRAKELPGGPSVQMWGGIPYATWQDDQWRMLTMVWRNGERRLYMDDYLGGEGKDVGRNPTVPGEYIELSAGSKILNDFTLWDTPLSAGDVAALFYARRPESGLEASRQVVPSLPTVPALEKFADDPAWQTAVHLSSWCDAVAGTAVPVADSLWLGHREGVLYLCYREPMPAEYEKAKTALGGTLLRRSAQERDSDVLADDAIELLLTPDRGQTEYRLAVSASGAQRDTRNGDPAFTCAGWEVRQHEDSRFWTVVMRVPLAALAADGGGREWGLNLVRTVRQQGFSRRQWSFAPDRRAAYGQITLGDDAGPPTPALAWDEVAGQLRYSLEGHSAEALEVEYWLTPLEHTRVLPGDSSLNPLIKAANQDSAPEPTHAVVRLDGGSAPLGWSEQLSYSGDRAALAKLVVRTAKGAPLAARSCLVVGRNPVRLSLLSLPSRQRLRAEVQLASAALASPDVVAELTLTPAGAQSPAASARISGFSSITGTAEFDLAALPVGRFAVAASVSRQGQPLGTAHGEGFHSRPPPWADNEIGVLKEVPPPWTPVQAVGPALEVWGRRYGFEHSLLPAALTVLGQEILAGPLRLRVRCGDRVLDSSQAATPRISVAPGGLQATLSGELADDALTLSMEGTLDFDGFLLCRLTLTPKPGTIITSLELEMPMRKEYATLLDDSSYDMFGTCTGTLPASGTALSRRGALRVGDSVRGVQLWPCPQVLSPLTLSCREPQPVTLRPEGDAMVLRNLLSDLPLQLAQPLVLEFGIIGTPVKPYDRQRLRRTFHGGPSVSPELAAQGYRAAQYWTASWSYLEGGPAPAYEDRYYHLTQRRADALAGYLKGVWDTTHSYYCLYLSPTMIPADAPEYALYQDEWRVVPAQPHLDLQDCQRDLADYAGAEKNDTSQRFGTCCWGERSYQDFYFYCLDRILAAAARQGVRVGVYVDNSDPHACANPWHGHGVQRADGTRLPYVPIQDYRRWVQRLYALTRRYSPDTLVVIHQSGFRIMGMWSMADTLVEGEQYSANWLGHIANHPELTSNDCYPQVLPLERVRAGYAARLWGPQHVFLTQFWSDERQKEDEYRKAHGGAQPPSYVKRMRHLAGLMWVHDTPLWGEFMWVGSNEPWAALAAWGLDETAEFVPYWEPKGGLECTSPDPARVVASAWYRADGKLAVLVLNDSDAAVTASLTLHPERFPVPLRAFARAIDIASPDPTLEPGKAQPDSFGLAAGKIQFGLRPRDFRLLLFQE